jgi:tetratricopeptide (TPR) repeat protein
MTRTRVAFRGRTLVTAATTMIPTARGRRRTSRLLAAAALLLALVAGTARAAEPRPDAAAPKHEAQQHYQAGLDRLREHAYREAVAEFQRAYQLRPHFAVLYNIAAAHVALGDAAAALDAFERYLAEGGAAVPTRRRAQVLAEMKHQQARTAQLHIVVSPAAAQVSLDGVPLAADALARPVRVNAGTHTVTAALDGYTPGSVSVAVAPAEDAAVTLPLTRPAPPALEAEPAPPAITDEAVAAIAAPPAAPPPPLLAAPAPATPGLQADRGRTTTGAHAAGYVLGAAGLLALGAGGIIYLEARSDWHAAIDRGCTTAGCPAAGAPYWQSARSGVTASRLVGGAGGVLLAVGAVLLLSGRW